MGCDVLRANGEQVVKLRVKHGSIVVRILLKMQLGVLLCLTSCLLSCAEEEGCWREMDISVSSEEISKIWGTSSDDVFAIGTSSRSGVVLHFNGKRWEEVPFRDDDYEYYQGVWGVPGRYFFLHYVLDVDEVVIVEYDGHNWSEIHTGITGRYNDIWGSSTDDIFAVGFSELPDGIQSRIMHFDGDNWTEMENNFSVALRSIWGSSSTDVFAVGSHSILHYDGNSWSVMEDSLPHALRAVWGASEDNVYVAGEYVLHYDGVKWTEIVARGSYGMWVSPDSEVFMLGGDEPVRYSDGMDWISICTISHNFGKNTHEYYSGVWGTSKDDVFVVGSKCKPVWYCQGIILRSNFKDDLNCFCE